MAKAGTPKRDGSGKGSRANKGRGGHKPLKVGKGSGTRTGRGGKGRK